MIGARDYADKNRCLWFRRFLDTVLSVTPHIQGIEIEPYVYHRPQEAAKLVEHLKPCDVVFFSGTLPFYFLKEARKHLPIPTLYFEQDEAAVASSLLSIIYQKNIAIGPISIDLTDATFITNVIADIGAQSDSLNVIDYNDILEHPFNSTEIISVHQSCFQSGTTDIALTSVHAVYDQLQQLGILAARIIDPKKQDARCQSTSRAC